MSEPRRLLGVHAHADDETITMGGTMALYADRGDRVANVCCTDGQLATIVDKEMAAREDEIRPRLAEIRREELRAACAILGVSELHFLGYHDSGMAGAETNNAPEAFWRVDVDEAVGRLVAVLRSFRPHVVVTYDGNGAYGHPDHIQAHRITLIAVEACHLPKLYPEAGPPWRISKLYYTAFPRSEARRVAELAARAGLPSPFGDRPIEELEYVAEDEAVTTRIDCRSTMTRKLQALRAFPSQIDETFPFFTVPEDVSVEHFHGEHYSLALSRVPWSVPEDDLFAGVEP
jgi:N-acetyl-1-D-myo-inositol-2-amino-2-deoxy-alpha-D-glucopyranoside deacetylase